MTRKEPQLHTTPEALARAVVRTRPYLGPERVKVFAQEAAARHKTRTFRRWKWCSAAPDTPSWLTAVPISPMAGSLSGGCPQGNRGYSSPKKPAGPGSLAAFRRARGLAADRGR